MEEEQKYTAPDETDAEAVKEAYQPRPWWQVWGARILLAAFLFLVFLYYLTIARGGA